MKYDFNHWDKTEMTQEEALAWFESEFEVTDGKRCSPTCPQCQAEEWAVKTLSVKQKKGKWIKRGARLYRCYRCSECGRFSPIQENFCPNCGAEMRGEEDE